MTPKKQYFENVAKTIIANLEKRQMEGYYCEDSEAAVKKVLEMIPEGASISWGGTMTMTETGMMAALEKGSYTLIDRMLAKTPQERKELYAKAVCADYYFMSTNAITLDGELVNIDGFGNRVACLCAGPDYVMILAGMNKLVSTVEEGHDRVRNIAAPMNSVRLNKNTPCFTKGRCFECLSPECLCSQIVVTRRSHVPGRIKVFLIGEELGY
ncbi:MAG: LUD domain-containing protein [Lachnospiraceae bacterium]|nr:LUD domain-containing protein [Lachnospiraceae bacterium]